jgi:hypothetical protein
VLLVGIDAVENLEHAERINGSTLIKQGAAAVKLSIPLK